MSGIQTRDGAASAAISSAETLGIGRQRIIMSLSGGGFLWQSRAVASGLAESFELHYVLPEDPSAYGSASLPEGPFHQISCITTLADRSLLRRASNTVRGLWETFRIVRQVKPHAIVCVATSIAVPLFFWGRLFGCHTVFVESITRVRRPSTTGRLLAALHLCERLYVQWPEAEQLYRGAIYRGSLL